VSVDPDELIVSARQVGAVLLTKGILGYVAVDFMSFTEDGEPRLIGFDIRLNCYPGVLSTAFLNLVSGYDPDANRLLTLNSLHSGIRRARRYAVIQNGLSHPAMAVVGAQDIRKHLYNNGMMFDLLTRTGFRIVFYEAPAEGKGFALSSGQTIESALRTMEQAYTVMLRYLGQKVGRESSSSIAQAIIGIRRFKSRIGFGT
jgi:hypothetical protein